MIKPSYCNWRYLFCFVPCCASFSLPNDNGNGQCHNQTASFDVFFFFQTITYPNATTQLKKYVSFLGGSRTQVIRQSIALSLLLGKILKNVSWVSKLGDWYFECSLDSIGYFDKNFDKVKVPTLTQTYFEIESKVGSRNLLGTLHALQVVNLFNFRAL